MRINHSVEVEHESSSNDTNVSETAVAAVAATRAQKRHYASWTNAAAETLLRLRYDAMQREFVAHTNPLEIAALWSALAAQLQRESGHKYTSLQCQSKVRCAMYVFILRAYRLTIRCSRCYAGSSRHCAPSGAASGCAMARAPATLMLTLSIGSHVQTQQSAHASESL